MTGASGQEESEQERCCGGSHVCQDGPLAIGSRDRKLWDAVGRTGPAFPQPALHQGGPASECSTSLEEDMLAALCLLQEQPSPGQWWGTGKCFSHVRPYCCANRSEGLGGHCRGNSRELISNLHPPHPGLQGELIWLVPHSHDDENTVLNLPQELQALLHREELLTLLQVQRESGNGQGQQLRAEGVPDPHCASGSEGKSRCCPKAAVLGHERRPGCAQE